MMLSYAGLKVGQELKCDYEMSSRGTVCVVTKLWCDAKKRRHFTVRFRKSGVVTNFGEPSLEAFKANVVNPPLVVVEPYAI